MADDLSDVIAELATGTYTVMRKPARVLNASTGEFAGAGTATTLSVLACVQPLDGLALQRLPEGRRAKATWSVWTATPLLSEDIITVNGEDFEVDILNDWTASGNFCKAIALRMGQ